MDFSRGDAITHEFLIPTDAWSSGGTLIFGAKPAIDDDATDAAAVIKEEWTDDVVTDVVVNGVAYKQYACLFPPSATSGILSNGAESTDYLGEFKWIDSEGNPTTFPADDPKIPVTVFFNVVLET